MALKTFSMIYLGNSADLDPTEGNNAVENSGGLIGTYYGSADPAFRHITTVTANNVNNNSVTEGNGFGGGETLTYDLGSGPVTTVLDFAATVNMTVVFDPASGQANYVGLGGIIQTAAGDLFLVMIDDDAGLGANALNDVPLQSIQVTSVSAAGQNQNAAASDGQQFVTCFVRGTEILTARGKIPVEQLRAGDLVQTMRHGFQTILQIAFTAIPADRFARNPKLWPVRISAGALGNNLPCRDLLVSRQHRMLATCGMVRKMFGCSAVFISAIKLTAVPGIEVDGTIPSVDYYHILLAKHDVIFAENAPTESLHTGAMALRALKAGTLAEPISHAPHFGEPTSKQRTAMFTPDNRLQKEFVAQCQRHQMSVLAPAPTVRAEPNLRRFLGQQPPADQSGSIVPPMARRNDCHRSGRRS